jgi:hypothetical protein
MTPPRGEALVNHPLLAALAGLLVSLTVPVAAVATVPPTSVNSCWSTDNGQPVLDSMSFSPTTVDTSTGPVPVTVTVHAHDTGGPGPATGIRRVSMAFRADNADSGTPVSPDLRTRLRPSGPGTWTGTVVVPGGANARYDAYPVIVDRAGLYEAGSGVEPAVHDAIDAAAGTPDTQGPHLTDLSVTPTTVDTRTIAATVHVAATLNDNLAGPSAVTLTSRQTGPLTLHRSGHTNTFRADVRVPRWTGSGRWRFSLDAADRDWNDRYYSHHRLVALGFPSSVQVTSGPADTSAPKVEDVTARPATLDLRRRGRWLVMGVHATDNRGVAEAVAGLITTDPSPTRTPKVALHLVSGSDRAGTWRGRIHLGGCFPGPARAQVWVVLHDGRGHETSVQRGDVRLLTLDRKPPFTRHADFARHRVSVTMSEPVHGISSHHVHVLTAGGSVIPGTWSCRATDGALTSCRRGRVRSATFTASDPASHAPDSVDWEPDHRLDVLDGAGNPFDDDTFSF